MPTSPMPPVDYGAGPVEAREVAVMDLVLVLRAHFGLPPEPSPRRDLPEGVPVDLTARTDVRLLIAWTALGLRILSEPMTMRAFSAEVRKVAALAAMRRHGGNRSRAGQDLGVKRMDLAQVLGLRSVEAGARVVAIESVASDAVNLYGRGTYTGRKRPPDGTRTRYGMVTRRWPPGFVVPRIELDRGCVIWGPQCTWMLEAEFVVAHGEKEVRFVPPP
jgi:hypothetical protein